MQPTSEIIGWGVDGRPEDRPGVPEARVPPAPLVEGAGPPMQQSGQPAVTSRYRPVTPVFGTTCPTRGLSGVLRQLAYQAPDYKARRWMLLMLADRVDTIEHNPLPMTLVVGLAAASVLGIRAVARRR